VLEKRRLGSTAIEVSCLGLGTVKFGRNQGVKYPSDFQLPTDAELITLLHHAKELGINLLDTAPAYGSSEARLGKLLRGQRQEWVISTKAGEQFINGASQFDFSTSALRQSIEESLRALQTDYLDIVLVHSDGHDEQHIQNDHVFLTLDLLKQEGKLRAYGMSTKTLSGGLMTIDHADVAMVTFNKTYTDERDIITYAHQQQKGIFIKKALDSGHLPSPHLSATDSLRFTLNEPGVSSVIIGTINPLHLQENAQAACR